MLIHKLKPGESIYIRGEIEIKNLTGATAKLGCIGDGEVSTDAVPQEDVKITPSSGCVYFDLDIPCSKSACLVCRPLATS